jgi:tetratricopeptide (TPR) repeat protein
MIHILFFLRFKAQLRRTRPELISRLEYLVAKAVELAGGKILTDRRVLTASFDSHSLGFWLDMLMLIESLMKELDKMDADLYGYSLIISEKLPETPEGLCCFLSGARQGGGVFLDRGISEGLLPYVVFEESENRNPGSPEGRGNSGAKFNIEDFSRIRGFKKFMVVPKHSALRESLIRALQGTEPQRNILILGPAFAGKREGVDRYCQEMTGDFPSLRLCFGGGGLTALSDAWTPRLRSLAGTGAADAEEINSLWEFLFKERLREELSDFIIRKAYRFFILLLEFYTSAARRRGLAPVIVLENLHQAEPAAAEIFIDIYAGIQKMQGLTVIGTWDERIGASGQNVPDKRQDEERLKKWESVFPRIIRPNEAIPLPSTPEMPLELWEIAYALSLFGRYFPACFLLRLFEEAGKNPGMISRALSLLSVLGITDSPQEGRPWQADFINQAEAVLGANKERVQALTRNRLLSWVARQKLSPCFRLLVILADLGGGEELNDQLILKSISSDLVNGTASGVARAVEAGLLAALAGTERAAAIRYIFETSRALLTGTDAIQSAFQKPPPECAAFPALKAQVLVNLSDYYLGLRDITAALGTIKEAILLSQEKNDLCLAQSYRLFSLVSLSKQQTGETIDYLGFAMDHAEKSGNHYELGVSAYYAAAAHFLFGNMSKAASLARKAREQSLTAGCPEWADRARFFEGRLAFEMGCYPEALDIFEDLRREPAGGRAPEKERLLAAWTYRARVYFQNPLTPKPEDGGRDADLFAVEAAYLAGNYHKTVELAGALTNPHIEENFLHIEQPDWRSGFAQCELLYFSRGELWDRLLCVYHSLALCCLSAAGGTEAIHNMQRILKSEQPPEMDPSDAFYFYAWYRVMEQTGAGQVDMNTAVSMAFKRLQRRASRIDDMELRRQFLFQPRWNKALSLAAKEYKLI